MAKKKYCPMTIEHEVLEMNQAVAACQYVPIAKYGNVNCDQCVNAGHTWKIFESGSSADGKVTQNEKLIIVSNGGRYGGFCQASMNQSNKNGFYPQADHAYEYTAQGRFGEIGDSNTYIQVNINLAKNYLGIVSPDGSIPGVDSIALATVTQNS